MAIVRMNFNAYEAGEEYTVRLHDEADRNFKILLALLSAYWQTTIDGPNYARHLKAMALALAQVRLGLEDLQTDGSFGSTRGEFLHQTVTSLLFPGESPDLQSTDVDFRQFLVKVVEVYFAGSTPAALKKAVELVTSGTVTVGEPHVDRRSGAVRDPADDFTADVDVVLPSTAIDTMLADRNVRILLSLVRPGHILYRIKYVLQASYVGAMTPSRPDKVQDSARWDLSDYAYEDFRKFVEGVEGVDPLGSKKSSSVLAEDHSSDF